METITKPLTFNPEGLHPKTIELLLEVEKLYFAGEPIKTDTLLKAGETIGITTGNYTTDMIEGWDYYAGIQRPLMRDSYKQAVKLSDLLTEGKDYSLNTHNAADTFKDLPNRVCITDKGLEIISGQMLYTLSPDNYYFEIVNSCLYIKYQHILGSRLIAFIQ